MNLKKTLLATLLIVPSISFAEVKIDIPRGIQLLTINGDDAGYSSLGFDYKENLTLNDGVNQIVFRIAKVVRESGSEKTKFKSTPIVATFNEKNAYFQLSVPNIQTLDQGMNFDSNPTFRLTADDVEPSSLKKDSINLGFSLMPDMVQEVKKYNQSTEVASLSLFQDTKPQTIVDEVEAGNNSSYEILKNAYNNASSEEKKRFLTWAISNFE